MSNENWRSIAALDALRSEVGLEARQATSVAANIAALPEADRDEVTETVRLSWRETARAVGASTVTSNGQTALTRDELAARRATHVADALLSRYHLIRYV